MSRPTHAPNRLIQETSPYLLQHAHNPVDWHPWGPEALALAREEQKPIFLSVGYSACHWCHVMERESFEDERTAELMNRHFVNVKVDREERPDLDEIYMRAVQAMTGSGGWPMSVFLTPDLEPFFCGTYFPPVRAWGRRSFPEIVEALALAWEQDRQGVVKRAKDLAAMLSRESETRTHGEVDRRVLDLSLTMLRQAFDPVWGGFGGAPKFPHAAHLRLLARHAKRTGEAEAMRMVMLTLDRMAEGGIYDQLGGGFHRYSTDERWLVPHFEKMLYDNALLVPAYLEAHLATGSDAFAHVARECCEWVLREMTTAEGAFASSQDADTEGEEGRFYAWSLRELETVLGAELARRAAEWYGVTDQGTFEHGRSVLWRHEPPARVAERLRMPREGLEAEMEEARRRLFAAREERIRPSTDDKVLASWNGLMISALAQSHQVLGLERHLRAARKAARFVLDRMRQDDGSLFATARGTRAHLDAYLDDYAFVIQALIDLYESDFDPEWLREALVLERIVAERFEDADAGGFFTTASDHERLLTRLKSTHDGALPAGSGVHALNLLRLAELTGRAELAKRAERTILSLGALVNRYPAGFSQLLMALDFLSAGPREIVVVGDPADSAVMGMLSAIRRRFMPQRVVALASPGADTLLLPLLEGRTAPEGGARAYVCRNYACMEPIETPEALAAQLE
jgi:uncharacterized protein YyaL (SSP411 family)